MSRALLRAENLEFSYTSETFLSDIGVEVTPGHVTCVVGPNGAGKTTLVMLLAGMRQPHNGVIHFGEKPITEYPRKTLARELALIPSDVYAPFSYTVYEFVEMGRYVHCGAFSPMGAGDRSAIEEAIAKTSLVGFEDHAITTLSSGEKQRAVIARSLAQRPQCLLMDEPTAHLDLHYQIEIHRLLRSLADDRKIGVLFISHDLNLAAQFADELIIMNDGRIVRKGSPREVIDEEFLSEIYRTPLEVFPHPRAGHKLVWPRVDG